MADTLRSSGWAYRGGVFVRAIAAIGGGYIVSALWAAAIATWLPATKVEAAVTGTLIALVAYPCAIMWCFAARSALRAWLGLAFVALLPAGALALQGGGA
jgi:Protein of unknown function (DUF3649)